MKKLIMDATRYVAMIVCARAGLCARVHACGVMDRVIGKGCCQFSYEHVLDLFIETEDVRGLVYAISGYLMYK